ncbi:deoxynucleoside kinase [Leucothrix pacifica]|uniref:Thymidylate kinase-like domain-containing protein n=1 Tax=Leucothrix pacifica TaxID=1247513 RepID=A0A317C1U4_9GAMM|nr:deoxynucleoside kinase [Leucothrix pacifica]PWQ92616.1 hypothetical protein DKW60_20290 [Leucothrix pacifica]
MNVIAIEGIDGAGKSTLLSALKEKYTNDTDVEFIKSPINPFSEVIADFWDAPAYTRFMYFAVSNYYLSKSFREDKVYILDRFLYSTYITHLENLDGKKMRQDLHDMGIQKPTITYLLHVPLEEIKERLRLRNNEIDNALNISGLYDFYYSEADDFFGEIEKINNVDKADLESNLDIISSKIDSLRKAQ